MPLKSKRFNFSELSVSQADTVKVGDVLARDPDNYNIPMVCPVDATVRLETDHIKLTNVVASQCYPTTGKPSDHISQAVSAEDKIAKLLDLGAWEFFGDAYSGDLPDPQIMPQAVIVSAISLEPFVARGDVQLKDELIHFTRGLEHLQTLLEYQQIYLVLPKIKSDFAELVRKQIRGYAWVNIIEVEPKYPYDNFNILARGLKLKSTNRPIWSLKTEGVLAIDDALTRSIPCIERVISVAGPDLDISTHIRVTTGYPFETIKSEFGSKSRSRLIDGGIMSGRAIDEKDLGISCETRGITFLPEPEKREFLGWMRPGFERQSYSGCFGSALLKDFPERLTTAVRGQVRPCISCNFCEEVCPAGIMPHLIHKYLYKDLIEDADRARVDLCVQCGLCSFVCTSKLELKEEFAQAKVVIEQEKEETRQIAIEREKAAAEQE
jgi:Na(+)-translocating NADH:ubiquinone oxidoreductase A subunit